MDLQLLEARWRTGRLLTSDLSRVAAELAAAGHEGPALTSLASGRADARETFERVLAELGRGLMTHEEAALVLARHYARQLLDAHGPPDLTARAIGGLRWKGGPGVDAAFEPFARLAERYERAKALGPLSDAVRPLLDRRARALARSLLAETAASGTAGPDK